MTQITVGGGKEFIETYLEEFNTMLLGDFNPGVIPKNTKIFVNGSWLGITEKPSDIVDSLKDLRRTFVDESVSHSHFQEMSVVWQIPDKEIQVWTDSGRSIRPLYKIDGKQ
eukprot:407410_1